MNTVTFYFTGTGNTKYVSDVLAATLIGNGQDAVAYDITNLSSNDAKDLIEGSDVVVIAYPIYGSDMPKNMIRFVEQLPKVKGKRLGVVCTQYLFSGDGASIMYKQLAQKGYNQLWSYQVNMPNNLCIKGSPFKQSSDYAYHEVHKLYHAREKIQLLCDNIITGTRRVHDNTPVHKLLGLTQRPAYRKFALKAYIGKIGVDADACVGCGLCVDACPNSVLDMVDGKASFSRKEDCTFCLRCLNFCEHGGITYGNSIKKPLYKGPTKRIYNLLFKKQ